MNHVSQLRCLICGETYQPDEVCYVCPKHGNEGILDVQYDYDVIAANISREALAADTSHPTIWRYKAMLPVALNADVPPLAVGGTPLYKTERIAVDLGLKHVWVKDDGRNPTASFKDRASAIAVVKAQEKVVSGQWSVIRNTQYAIRNTIITTASTGNAAAALAGICASVGQPNVIFVPKSAPEAKIAQLLVYGAQVLLVDGTYDEAFELCLESAETYNWYNRNTGYNPYMTEGKKTVSYEIAEQLGWDAPDVVLVSVGDGCIIGGIHKGFKDLLAMGWIEKMPRLIGVQSQGSNYLTEAWENGEDVLTKPAIAANTIADSISAGLPRDRIKAMRAVTETGGAFIAVSDDDILAAIPTLAQKTGVFAEPAGAAAYAGLVDVVQRELVQADERIVVINTGNGLKDVRGAMGSLRKEPMVVRPNIEDVRKIFDG